MKKRTALMLALLMCCLAFLVSCDLEELLATAQKTTEATNQNTTSPLPESQALEYKVNEGGDSCTVTGIGTYKGTILDIPSQINGYTVACIGADAFANCSQIVSLSLPSTITIIESNAFENCEKLIGVSITNLASWCQISFATNTSNPLSNGAKLYLNGKSVSHLTIPNNTHVSTYSFAGCTSLTSVTIPSSVHEIGSEAFADCPNLTSVHITDLSAWCDISFASKNANPLYYGAKLYLNNELVTQLTIPDTVTEIKDYAFYGYKDLTSVTLPSSVTRFQTDAFTDCTNLTSIHISDLKAWCELEFAFGTANPLYNGAKLYLNAEPVTRLNIPDTITEIKAYTFYGYEDLTSVVFPNHPITVGHGAFAKCSNITGVHISNLTTWCSNNFETSTSNPLCNGGKLYLNGELITQLTIPDTVTEIKDYVFSGYVELTSVLIPSNVEIIGQGAFHNCKFINSAFYVGSPESWNAVKVKDRNSYIIGNFLYFYSEFEPDGIGNYWRYVDGIITPWVIDPVLGIKATSSYDNNGDGQNDAYRFSPSLPQAFATPQTILIAGADHHSTDVGVTALEEWFPDIKIYHYYIDLNQPSPSHEEKVLSWTFTVPETGLYKVCYNLRVKTNSHRGNIMQIDNEDPIHMDYQLPIEAVEVMRDAYENTYMTGLSVNLTAGTHTIRMTYNPDCPKTFQFRNLYLVKAS